MKTFKPISCITYCSIDYLKSQLNALINMGDIDFWALIFHYKEEELKKDHVHLYIEPVVTVETRDLQFRENELIGSMSYEKSKFGHWFYYGLHDKEYCDAHDLGEKKYRYLASDFITSCPSTFNAMWQSLDKSLYLTPSFNTVNMVKRAVLNGLSWGYLIANDYIPPNQYNNLHKMYNDLVSYYSSIKKNDGEIKEEFTGSEFLKDSTSVKYGDLFK